MADEHLIDVVNMLGHGLEKEHTVIPKQVYLGLVLLCDVHHKRKSGELLELEKVQACISQWQKSGKEVSSFKQFVGEDASKLIVEFVAQVEVAVQQVRLHAAHPVPPQVLQETEALLNKVCTPKSIAEVKGFLTTMEKKHTSAKTVAESMVETKEKLESGILAAEKQGLECKDAGKQLQLLKTKMVMYALMVQLRSEKSVPCLASLNSNPPDNKTL